MGEIKEQPTYINCILFYFFIPDKIDFMILGGFGGLFFNNWEQILYYTKASSCYIFLIQHICCRVLNKVIKYRWYMIHPWFSQVNSILINYILSQLIISENEFVLRYNSFSPFLPIRCMSPLIHLFFIWK